MLTLISGLILAHLNGYLISALQLGIADSNSSNTAIGIGMWLAIIMWFNVWFVIWPNQKKGIRNSRSFCRRKSRCSKNSNAFL